MVKLDQSGNGFISAILVLTVVGAMIYAAWNMVTENKVEYEIKNSGVSDDSSS